ncbi:UDP-N-acetylmuramoyl-tripeptide--D-alanyl-D-alanine ligase [Paenibacillus sp. MBLB4367]|uniref:UDP-N-acetylmuramoyl-tripeptide--D-alanyl-D- alanine ligase n=1 Tax=Paenibacillus sp. MBLB4367 TaxID=3384767 RepID=UPI0039082C47
MITRTCGQIAQMVGKSLTDAGSPSGTDVTEIVVKGVCFDTRNIKPGNLFVPLIGQRDGHDYVLEALAKGAAAALWQIGRPKPEDGLPLIEVDDTLEALQQLAHAYRNELPVRIVGITGSNGKTTTKDLTASLLGTTYKVHKTAGNLNNHIGLPMTLLEMDEQTEMAVLEMGMSGRGEIELLSRIAEPEAVIVTNIGEAHLLQLGTREEIARAKTEILSGLKPDGFFVYNGDEPLIEQVLPDMPQPASMLRYRFGASDRNDLYPVGVMQDGEGTHFQTNLPGSRSFYIPLLGLHNVVNALAAIAVAKFMGVCDDELDQGLKDVELTSMRIEPVKLKNGAFLLNDAYNASPTSMQAGLSLLTELKGYSRKFAVLGDMLELGPSEEEFHREIGRGLDPESIDGVFTYGKLARNIAEEAAVRFGGERVRPFDDKADLIRELRGLLKEGDAVIVKGSRGMRLEEVIHALQAEDETV